jgi:polyhydroxybutyrate depolymerase
MKHSGIATKVAIFLLAVAISIAFTALASATEPIAKKSIAPGNHVVNILVGSLERHYVVHVPINYTESKPLPVVIMFHGGGGKAKGAMRETGWADKADQEGFLAVFPEGTRRNPHLQPRFVGNAQTWNDGSKNHLLIGAVRRRVDDVGFVNALIDDLIARYNVDQHRIYAAGFSNGAAMAFRVGRELSNRIAAIAPVSGTDWLEQPVIREPVSLLYITGTADPLNPIDGGEIKLGPLPLGTKPPVREFIQKWIKMLGCSQEQKVIFDKDGVKGRAYGQCQDGAEVIFYTIEGMGHCWPGGKSFLPERIVGKCSDKMNATDVIWKFFQDHRKK